MLGRDAEGEPPCRALQGMHETIARGGFRPRATPYGSGYQPRWPRNVKT